jgi:hypothetical protein
MIAQTLKAITITYSAASRNHCILAESRMPRMTTQVRTAIQKTPTKRSSHLFVPSSPNSVSVLDAATPASEIMTMMSATMMTQPVKKPSVGCRALEIQA